MYHMFDVDIAVKYGVNAAILLQSIFFWVQKNKANDSHFYDGRYWTYNSHAAFTEIFPYLSERQVKTALDKLIEDGVLLTGNYGKDKWKRPTWYAFTEKGWSMIQNSTVDGAEMYDRHSENVSSYTDIYTDTYTDINNNKGGTVRFVKPTIEELSAYALEIDYNLDPQAFMDYYDGNGWMVGKNHMKDWKAAVRTWKRRAIERGLNTRANRPEPTEPDITPEQAAEARRILEAGGGWG